MLYRITDDERKKRLDDQKQTNKYHKFVENNLILKQGFVDKRKVISHVRNIIKKHSQNEMKCYTDELDRYSVNYLGVLFVLCRDYLPAKECCY